MTVATPGDYSVVDGGGERRLGVLIDVEEDGLHERAAPPHDVVVQPDGARSNAVRVELGGEVVPRAQEIRVEYDEKYVQRQQPDYTQQSSKLTSHWFPFPRVLKECISRARFTKKNLTTNLGIT